MAVYPVGTPSYQFRGGELFRVQQTFDSDTGQTDEDAQPVDESAAAGDQAGTTGQPFGPTVVGRVGDMGPTSPQGYVDYGNTTPQGTVPGGPGRLGDITGNVGQFANYGAATPSMQQYGVTPKPNAASQTYGNQGGPMPSAQQPGNSLNPQQQAAYGQVQMPPGAGANTAAGTAGGPADADYARSLAMYDPANPVTAVENIIQDMGLGRGFGNPFVSFIKSMAQGLATSYLTQNALTPGVGAGAATQPYAFRDFLMNSLSQGGAGAAGAAGAAGGALGGGHAMSNIIGTAAKLPQLIEAIRALNQSGAQNPTTINPFLEQMATMLQAGTGEGTTGFLASLYGPAMNETLGKGYASGLTSRLRNAQRAAYGMGASGPTAGAPMGPGDIWTHLLGAK